MEDAVSKAKSEFVRAKDRLAHLLATTPDDRINWSPSDSCRTPVQVVAHSAGAIKHIHGFLDGRPFDVGDPTAADKMFREYERQFTTREAVSGLLDQNSAAYLAFLDTLTPERLQAMVQLPFGLGTAPVAACLGFPAAHTQGHVAQLEYIQSIYGDHDWHL